MTDTVLSIDLGGTNFRVALMDREGAVLLKDRQPTRIEEGLDAVIARIIESARAVRQGASPRAIGVAAPGPLDPFKGVILMAPNMPGWINVPLRDRLSAALDLPCVIDNDANLAGLGEQRYGAGSHAGADGGRVRNLVYFTVSTGIGGGAICDDRLIRGARGFATEFGYFILDMNAPAEHTGVPGNLEGMCAGPAIARYAQQRLLTGRASRMLDLAGGIVSQVTARHVSEAAQAGDALALEIVRRTGRILGYGVINAIHAFDPEIVVLGGSVTLMGELLFEPLRATVKQFALEPYQDIPIVRVALGDDAGLAGAAALAFESVGS